MFKLTHSLFSFFPYTLMYCEEPQGPIIFALKVLLLLYHSIFLFGLRNSKNVNFSLHK